jgi:NADPH:quinone reductase-like Zn-dependent oxidoreductase
MGRFDEANPITPLRLPRRKASISHEEAATLPVVGVTAWRGLIQKGRLKLASSSFSGRKLTMTASDSGECLLSGNFHLMSERQDLSR